MKIIAGIIGFITFVIVLLTFLIDFTGYSEKYYKNQFKTEIIQQIKNDEKYVNFGIEILEIKGEIDLNPIRTSLTIMYNLLPTPSQSTIQNNQDTNFLLISLAIPTLLVLILILDIFFINKNKTKTLIDICYYAGLIVAILCLTCKIVYDLSINHSPDKMLQLTLKKNDLHMLVKYNKLDFLNYKNRDLIITSSKINNSNYENTIKTELNPDYLLIHEDSLICDLASYAATNEKENFIKDIIINDMKKVKRSNNNIKVHIFKTKINDYQAIIQKNKEEIYYNNIYMTYKNGHLYLKDPKSNKTDLYFKCENGRHKLYYQDSLITESKKSYKIDNIWLFISINFYPDLID